MYYCAVEGTRNKTDLITCHTRKVFMDFTNNEIKIEKLLSVLSSNYEAIYFIDFDNDVIEPYRQSEKIKKLLGAHFEERPTYTSAFNIYINTLLDEQERDNIKKIADKDYIISKLRDRPVFSYDYKYEYNGKTSYYRFKISKVDEGEEVHQAVAGFADITFEFEGINSLREKAAMISVLEKDELTGLYNKEFFFKKADKFMAEHPEENLIIWTSDILGLKIINEKYGEEMGDTVLKLVADGCVSTEGYILGGRIEGDKICVLSYDNGYELAELERKYDNGANVTFPIPNVIVNHGLYHVGHNNHTSAQGMYDRAMIALNSIKDNYGKNIAEYDDNIRKELLLNRLIMENAEAGLEKDEFHIYFQKKHDAMSGEVVGAEALVRWIHPELGFLSPGIFIPLFEKNGFITKMDFYVWEKVCQAIKRWTDLGIKVVPVSINVSRRDFDDVGLAHKIIQLVDKYGIDHDLIHIEVTESAYSDDPKIIIDTVRILHEAGFEVELDDFGTGYSSMLALGSMDLDVMKIDMSLVQGEELNSEKSLLKFSLQLAQMMQLKTVAEGVETEEQATRIRDLGGNVIQGYLFSKPMCESDFEQGLAMG